MIDEQFMRDAVEWLADEERMLIRLVAIGAVKCKDCKKVVSGPTGLEYDHAPDCLHIRAKAARDEMARPQWTPRAVEVTDNEG